MVVLTLTPPNNHEALTSPSNAAAEAPDQAAKAPPLLLAPPRREVPSAALPRVLRKSEAEAALLLRDAAQTRASLAAEEARALEAPAQGRQSAKTPTRTRVQAAAADLRAALAEAETGGGQGEDAQEAAAAGEALFLDAHLERAPFPHAILEAQAGAEEALLPRAYAAATEGAVGQGLPLAGGLPLPGKAAAAEEGRLEEEGRHRTGVPTKPKALRDAANGVQQQPAARPSPRTQALKGQAALAADTCEAEGRAQEVLEARASAEEALEGPVATEAAAAGKRSPRGRSRDTDSENALPDTPQREEAPAEGEDLDAAQAALRVIRIPSNGNTAPASPIRVPLAGLWWIPSIAALWALRFTRLLPSKRTLPAFLPTPCLPCTQEQPPFTRRPQVRGQLLRLPPRCPGGMQGAGGLEEDTTRDATALTTWEVLPPDTEEGLAAERAAKAGEAEAAPEAGLEGTC